MANKWGILMVLMCLSTISGVGTQATAQETESLAEKARQAARAGQLAYRLTTLEDFKAMLGPPVSEKKEQDGGMELLNLRYSVVAAQFVRTRENGTPFTLRALMTTSPGSEEGNEIDIGQNRTVELRSADDLAKFDAFWGFAGISLARVDLRAHQAILDKMPYDSRTHWPGHDKLPEGFDPVQRLERGKSPGLGVAGLHAQGLDGHGVGIAIIDQPLVQDHQEYAGQLMRYEPIDVASVPPQMHGPAVASLAVGRTCGVAPKAALYHYAVPMWNWGRNKPYAELLEKIIERNKTLRDGPRVGFSS
ncbi:MAG: hypothetical protein MUC88_08360 [Planctomycetes bacterium]|nr:hypothetical protein [Planctomycetota bacterium]